MEINKVQWRMIAKGEKLPCDSFLMRKDGTMTSMVTGAGVTVGQDAYYLPVEELRSFPKEESEDERIIQYFKELAPFDKAEELYEKYGFSHNDAIDWLEKQAEQKPDDKVEPKFKVGDYVVGKYISGYISEVRDDCYLLDYQGFPIDKQDNYHLWTIQDAKAGDVLVASDGSIFLFAGVVDWACKYYVALTTDNIVKFNEGLEHYWETSRAVHPATQEQHNALMKAIADAGYTFDFYKKELKKVEQNTTWSEEDEYHKRQILRILKDNGCSRTLQEKTEKWIEERLKSLRPHSRWKPSDEQMDALRYVTNFDYGGHKATLVSLYEQLKKLK